ncbi:hypothetical protein FBU59_004346 [Linderina macrospora]|uniref:Uncharacterized protein n=1 Tax=Linderina macrospora TaxID=4868 RepID=A0ACC1J5Y3_9FUNG|nr:hypothetical protein FBU59_004346 [Linderina macrospora]
MMIQNVVHINWKYVGDAVPAFLTIIMIPFGYSIGYGLISGILTYIAINGFIWIVAKVTRDRIVPPNRMDKEMWSAFMADGGALGILPEWLRKVLHIKYAETHSHADEQEIELEEHIQRVSTQQQCLARGSAQHIAGDATPASHVNSPAMTIREDFKEQKKDF